jgi:hypothetical protein
MKKQSIFKNKRFLFIFVLALVTALTCVAIGISYAVWINTPEADHTQVVPIAEWNPSETEQLFHALDAHGLVITGTITNTNVIHSFALVGYTGLVDTLITRRELNVEGRAQPVPVTHILHPTTGAVVFRNNFAGTTSVARAYTGGYNTGSYTGPNNIGFRNSFTVKNLIIESSIIYIGAFAFDNVSSLQRVEFRLLEGQTAQALVAGTRAFSNSPIATVVFGRSLTQEQQQSIFQNTPFYNENWG